MTGFYDTLAATSKKLLTSKGRNVTLRRLTQGAYDPSTSTQAVTSADLTFKGAMFDMEGDADGDRDLILSGDKMLLLEPAATPTSKDKIVVDGLVYEIVGIKSINPAGTVVLYKLHLRA